MGAATVRYLALGQLVTGAAGVVSVSCALEYDPTDPWAVTLTLWQRSPSPVVWLLAREQLAAGRHDVVNPGGGVTVSPSSRQNVWGQRESQVRIDLANPREGRRAVVLFNLHTVDAFLAETYRRVPTGAEARQIEWDPVLRAWTGDDTGRGWAA